MACVNSVSLVTRRAIASNHTHLEDRPKRSHPRYNPPPVRRILEIDTPAGAPQRLLGWLDPCGDGVLFGVQPLET